MKPLRYLSLGAGVQSSTVYLMAVREGEPAVDLFGEKCEGVCGV